VLAEEGNEVSAQTAGGTWLEEGNGRRIREGVKNATHQGGRSWNQNKKRGGIANHKIKN